MRGGPMTFGGVVLCAGVVLAAGCGSSTTDSASSTTPPTTSISTTAPKAPPSVDQLDAALLTSADLGTGWGIAKKTTTTTGAGKGTTTSTAPTELCPGVTLPASLAGLGDGSSHPSAAVEIENTAAGAHLSQAVVSVDAPGAEAAVSAMQTAVDSCMNKPATKTTSKAGTALGPDFVFEKSPLGPVGDQSVSVRGQQTGGNTSLNVTSDILLARQGSVIMLVSMSSGTGTAVTQPLTDADWTKINAALQAKAAAL